MGVREELGYDDADEAWRRNAARSGREGATQAAKDVGRIAQHADDRSTYTPRFSPDGRPICLTCGRETDILHSVAGEVVVVDGMRLVGCVRTSCWTCASKAVAQDERGRVTCQ